MELIARYTMPDKKYTYSEIFHSIQGEGHYTGVPTAWIRFFLCNLQCDGFGQMFPTKPETYDLPYADFDASKIERVEDLPVWEKGCDSSYTWSKKYKHLMGQETGPVLAQKIVDIMKNEHNPEGWFRHPLSGHHNHLCITGGEPLMKLSQMAFLDIYEALTIMPGGPIAETSYMAAENLPSSITWETNGTQRLSDDFVKLVKSPLFKPEAFFSVSPKLWTVAGEKREKAIKPDIVKSYYDVSDKGQLKFVVGPEKEQWEELDEVVALFREAGVKYPIWIMPTGARLEEQEKDAGDVARMAFERGYNVSGRMHVYLFGNAIGT
jgi:7-carboxy-7-deazaguanine synthase